MAWSGLLNIDKPTGTTSRRVVDDVERLVRPSKAGHAGTLDPLASGVLVVCVGAATRLIQYVQQMPKRYVATFLLGRRSPTEDIEGDVELLPDAPQPALEELAAAAGTLVGEIQQRPPIFSALKVAGRRAYDLARAGREVELQPRPVTIHRLDVLRYDYPELVLEIECSSGTYVRSLGRDLAEQLGTSAVMSALSRTAIGSLTLDNACRTEDLNRDTISKFLLPASMAVASLPAITLTLEEARRIGHGLSIERIDAGGHVEWAALDEAGNLVAILGRRADGSLGPTRNLAQSS
jgi:tRNA pseudouridine55 synthase